MVQAFWNLVTAVLFAEMSHFFKPVSWVDRVVEFQQVHRAESELSAHFLNASPKVVILVLHAFKAVELTVGALVMHFSLIVSSHLPRLV